MKKQKGFIILEAMLAIVVLSLVVLSVVPMLSYLLRKTAKSRYEPQAALLLQEAMEVSYNIFISNWSAYPVDGTYHPGVSSANKWVLFSGTQTNLETIYSRKIEIYRACRDAQGRLIESAAGSCGSGTRDPNSRIIKAVISWDEEGSPKELTAQLLLTNLESD